VQSRGGVLQYGPPGKWDRLRERGDRERAGPVSGTAGLILADRGTEPKRARLLDIGEKTWR